MSKKIGIGIIGCGTIADVYMTNITQHYDNLDLLAVADIYVEKAQAAAEKFNVPKACTVEELLAMEDVQIVLNLTIPAAHYSVNMQVLNAGKHLYCEKPLTLEFEQAKEVAALAKEKGLMAVSAPDTFLGAGAQTCREVIDNGSIGDPCGFTANMTCPGHEIWHPAPGFYYKNGGGPMFDMGPYYLTTLISLMGPIKRISCFTTSGRPMRKINGVMTESEVPCTYSGTMEFANGAVGTMTMSFDIWASKLPDLEVYGTKGSLTVPNPDSFGGPVGFFDGEELNSIVEAVDEETEAPYLPSKFMPVHVKKVMTSVIRTADCHHDQELLFADPNPNGPMDRTNMRGLGVSDMAQSLIEGRPARLSTELSVHVVEALNAFRKSAETGEVYNMTTTCERPAPMGHWDLWKVC